MDYVDACPMVVVERIRQADLSNAENSTLFSWIASKSALECQGSALQAIADRLNERSDPTVIDDFCGSVATYARFLTPEVTARVKAAYLRFPYSDAIAMNYFLGLRQGRIDIRDQLRDRVVEAWDFEQPRRDAATWHYYLYLASLGEPGALDRLARKIAATGNGNDATNLLASLSELNADGVDAVLKSYAEDQRTADGTEGPGLPISDNVKLWLMMRQSQ